MFALTGFELGKVWCRRSFLLALCALLLLNLSLLWYTNLPDEENPGLSAYRALQGEIQGMSEREKGAYVSNLKETMDGVCFVEEVLALRRMPGEMGEALTAQAMETSPGVFEAYYDLYQRGGYLKFTDSLWQESRLAGELYREWEEVREYGAYLQSVQENRDTLGGIGIFGVSGGEDFSARNVEKSARDYGKLDDRGIRWMPGRALTGAMEDGRTDLLLLLSVFLFVGHLVPEEKEKRLFYITRSTAKGILPSIGGKLAALLIHCMAMALLLWGENLVFFGCAAGLGDLGARLQSVAAYRESAFQMDIWQYILLSMATKGFALFGFGAVLTALCILADSVSLPYAAGGLWCGVGGLLYAFVPPASKGTMFKYLNLAGSLRTEQLYGAYLNFNLLGRPVSRTALTWAMLAAVAVGGVIACACLFSRGEGFELREKRLLTGRRFRPHASLLRHEGYKVMWMGRAGMILLAFAVLIGGRNLKRQYTLSAQEQYYQDIMLELEGGLTEEKEEFILAEEARYREAFDQIERIDGMVAAGELDASAGEDMKAAWYAVTAFYPSFARVWRQYEGILETGGNFIYDTGYLYLLGTRDDGFLIDFLLLTCCVILAFGNGMSMEDAEGAWCLLGATLRGKRGVIWRKSVLCASAGALLALVPFGCRAAAVSAACPLHGLGFPARDIPYCGNLAFPLTVAGLLALLVLSQALALAVTVSGVLALSYWRKSAVRAYFFAALAFAAPLVLDMLGLGGPQVLYPLYAWTARL